MLMCKLAKRRTAEGTLGMLQMSGIIHEMAASGVLSVKKIVVGPLHRGTSGLGLKVGDDEDSNQDDTINSSTGDGPPANQSLDGGCGRYFCLGKSAKISALKEQMMLSRQKPVGPHGRYCLCGCRNVSDEY